MFLDPRLGGAIPTSRNISDTYQLSPGRSLYLRLTSPHEARESLSEFLQKIVSRARSGRWCVAAPIQVTATPIMPAPPAVVAAVHARLKPERIRVCLLSPDYHGNHLPDASKMTTALRRTSVCEVFAIDARDRQRNGLLLADTFDFA
jgi:hypothetical protein